LDLANITLFKKISDEIKDGYVVYGGDKHIKINDIEFVNFREMASIFST